MSEKPTRGLWWVSVGGEKCEPARIENSVLFTIGCGDGTAYNENCGIELVKKIESFDIPDTPKETELKRKAWEKKLARDEARGIYHGYRRFPED